MGKHIIRRTIGAAATAAALMLATSHPAGAADGYQETVRGTPSGVCDDARILTTWGDSCFVAAGDVWWLYDKSGDGQSIAMQWHLRDGSRSGLIRDKLGQGVNTILNKDYPESAWVVYRLGRCNQTGTVSCRYASQYNSWSQWTCQRGDGGGTLDAWRACINEAN